MSLHLDPPPEGLGPDDLASPLLLEMGVGRTQANMIAASEALKIRGCGDKTVAQAYVFIVEQWKAYKSSEHYHSQFRRKAAVWLSEGDYDNPESWGGKPLPKAYAAAPVSTGDSVKDWARDKELHPEKYPTPAEAAEFFKQLEKLIEGKRMPEEGTSAKLKQKDC